MALKYLFLLAIVFIDTTSSVRLNTLFQYIDGYSAEHGLQGFLHVGNEYAVFLQTPKPNDRFLTYELYEAKDVDDISEYKPKLLAISKVPIDYIKEQLSVFLSELSSARYSDPNTVPGTNVKTLREWQIDRAMESKDRGGDLVLRSKPKRKILRTDD